MSYIKGIYKKCIYSNLDNLYFQSQYILTLAVQKKMPTYEANPILRGLIYNMHLLNGMDQGEFDFDKLLEGKSMSMHQSAVECVVSGLLANFNALYIYPYEDVYLNGCKYAEERFDQFDFGELDFSFINPKKLTIYTAPLDQSKMVYDAKYNEASTAGVISTFKSPCAICSATPDNV